jgi:fructose-1,6-bisphosphatase I
VGPKFDCTPRYGSSANLVLSTGNGVNGFTLDPSLGEFVLTHPDIKIPSRGKIYSFNEGNSLHFHPPTVNDLNSIKFPLSGKSPYSARYVGSMVADVHRTLLYGGIFGYPADKKSKSGKLRLLYEAFPMAFLTEQVCNVALVYHHTVIDDPCHCPGRRDCHNGYQAHPRHRPKGHS